MPDFAEPIRDGRGYWMGRALKAEMRVQGLEKQLQAAKEVITTCAEIFGNAAETLSPGISEQEAG